MLIKVKFYTEIIYVLVKTKASVTIVTKIVYGGWWVIWLKMIKVIIQSIIFF